MLLIKKQGAKIKNIDKKIEKILIDKENKALKKPAEIKKIVEQNRFGGYYKTKKRFIN
jgi:hypothetical protein